MTDHSQSPVWQDAIDRPRYPSITRDQRFDVAIIGGGITGVTAALLLKRGGLRVAVIEAQRIGDGVTGATTAHLTTMLDARYADLRKTFGQEKTKLVVDSVRHAIRSIGRLASEHGIACDYVTVPGFLYAEPGQDTVAIEAEIETMRSLGLPVSAVSSIPLPIAPAAALRVEEQAQFHPLKYLVGLAGQIEGDGSAIFENSRVDTIDDGEPCQVHTAGGIISATAVLMATHTPINELLLTHARVTPYRSYVLALDAGDIAPDALLWDVADPYHYTRSATIDGRRLLIVGGEDHKTGQEDDTTAPFARLRSYAKARFGQREVVRQWSAQLYEPADGLPYIGRQLGKQHIFMTAGYSGTGMTFGTIAAEIIAGEILGAPSQWGALYDSKRLSIGSGGAQIVKEGLNVAVAAIAGFVHDDGGDVESIQPGEGKIIRRDGVQVAAYRDEHGALTMLSPRCTHAGCIVGWNTAERSWDCPCHGGRFAATGSVLEGPPTAPLAPYEAKSGKVG